MTRHHVDLGGFSLDLQRLIETRLLLQANSGGGKGWALRKILEATHGKVQQIVIDPEGEFSSLREKFDYILAGKGGDIPADPRSAELLARKVLELETSIIIDLFELKPKERIRFVRIFLEALINAPKDLWHEVLVAVDEAHLFAPEKGEAESLDSVIDLASRGRKRGFCALLATQRLSKLSKDAAAECNNKLIGRAALDVDVKRAAEELGFAHKDAPKILRQLEPGEFFSFGPALSREVTKVKIGMVETTHPKAGQRLRAHAPAPTAKVKQILGKLADLPKEAEEELKDRAALQARVRELERELKGKLNTSPLNATEKKALYEKAVKAAKKEIGKTILKLNYTLMNAISPVVNEAIAQCNEAPVSLETLEPKPAYVSGVIKIPNQLPPGRITYEPRPARAPAPVPKGVDAKGFGRCERMILKFLAMRAGNAFTNVQVAALTGYASGSGGFNNALSKLSQAGLIVREQGRLAVNDSAIPQIQELLGPDYSGAGQHSLEDWLNKLGKCERSIYEFLLRERGTSFGKQALGEATGYTPGSGGFNNALSRLNTLGLIKRVGGNVQLNDEIVGI